MKLYELAENYRKVQEFLDDDEINMKAVKDTLDAIEEEIIDKCENIAKLIKTLEAEEKAFRDEEERLFKKRKAIENKIEWLRKYTAEQLERAGIERIKGKIFTVLLQPTPPAVEIVDMDTFMREGTKYLIPQPPKIDKKLIMEDIKGGKEVPGVILKQEKSLRIR